MAAVRRSVFAMGFTLALVGFWLSSQAFGQTPTPTPTPPPPLPTPVVATGTGSISGSVIHDLDWDGVLEAGEPGLEGCGVDLGSVSVSPMEKATQEDGSYSFDNLPAGTYHVMLPPGPCTSPAPDDVRGIVTFPADATYRVELREGEQISGIDFGLYLLKAKPTILQGNLRVDGRIPPAGTLMQAKIGDVVCGEGKISPFQEGVYGGLIVFGAADRDGCGTQDAIVRFAVGGRLANEEFAWKPGFHFLDLTVGGPSQLPDLGGEPGQGHGGRGWAAEARRTDAQQPTPTPTPPPPTPPSPFPTPPAPPPIPPAIPAPVPLPTPQILPIPRAVAFILEGKARAPSGEPLDGLTLTVQVLTLERGFADCGETTVGADGNFSLEVLSSRGRAGCFEVFRPLQLILLHPRGISDCGSVNMPSISELVLGPEPPVVDAETITCRIGFLPLPPTGGEPQQRNANLGWTVAYGSLLAALGATLIFWLLKKHHRRG